MSRPFFRAIESCSDRRGILGEEGLIFPPNQDYGYEATPRNSLTFGAMGVDGVHYALLTQNGRASDDSPVVSISPMDGEAYWILAATLMDHLARACGVTEKQMKSVFADERKGSPSVAAFLKQHFDQRRLLKEKRRDLAEYLDLIERKP